jgi:hypothetical protein
VAVVRVEVLRHPRLYGERQVREAQLIAYALGRGTFVLPCLPRTEELLVALVAGDLVVYKAHREWGTGIVEWVVPDGLLVVAFEVAGKPYRSDFGEGELERATPRIARTA